ncbi:DUF1648 domain-containing protein [Metabacillus iocasae]|uniref:Membrane protein n=1 Tax=Priestia iocasae TaxID=2291674 RepID=A0ABS2QT20_9BACI|nr:DUF5808 domain-containing protein [Metabacillus iocasae]MBM7702333.1 putative membrane protein [Metabacillus iocasae]
MDVTLLFVSLAFLVVMQTIVPFIVKRTVVFGVTVPVEEVKNEELRRYKKTYAALTLSGSIIVIALAIWFMREETIMLAALFLPFVLLFLSLTLYFVFHMKVTKLKQEKSWFKNRKQVRVSELNLRLKDEMLPWVIYLIPVIITFGLLGFSVVNYAQFPDPIPTHWGPDGKPDAWTDKSYVSVLALPMVLLVLNGMFLGINELTKLSGIKLSARNVTASRARQLQLRKYSSWFLFFTAILVSILFTFLQFNTLYGDQIGDLVLVIVPLVFSILMFIGAVFLAIKVGKRDSDFELELIEDGKGDTINIDDDRYWKGGLIYFNRQDPSVFVEKRFGVGFTLNFARPLGYAIILGPLLLLLLIVAIL